MDASPSLLQLQREAVVRRWRAFVHCYFGTPTPSSGSSHRLSITTLESLDATWHAAVIGATLVYAHRTRAYADATYSVRTCGCMGPSTALR
jgi:hypothetical protein